MTDPFRKPLFVFVFILLAALLGACSISLAGDVTPPPGSTTAPATPEATSVALPFVPADPGQGEAIYIEKCAPCHGSSGMGDGPQAGSLPNPVPALNDGERARSARPLDWFETVTTGNLERLMPPFENSLSERQRWDVVAYLYTLSTSKQELAQGKVLYEMQCQSCHGAEGRGDGPQASSVEGGVPSWRDPARLVQWSNQQLWAAITDGLGSGMPAYKASLNDDQRWALTSYVRMLSFASPSAGNVASPSTSSAGDAGDTTAGTGNVVFTGRITNGSNGELPTGLKVVLHGFDGMQAAYTQEAEVQPDGNYTFPDVALVTDRVYIATVEVNGILFNSNVLRAADLRPDDEASLPITVYDTSSDPSPLVVERVHIFFEFVDPGWLQVVELFIISNPTQRVIVSAAPDQPVFEISLPPGYSNLQFEEGSLGDRFVQTANGFGDTQGVMPDPVQHQLLFAYELPYSRKLDLSLPMSLPVQAVVVAIPTNGVRLTSSQLRDSGRRSVQGIDMQFYAASSLEGGSSLEMNISGKPRLADQSGGLGNEGGLLFGLGALVLAVAIVAWWYYQNWRRTHRPAPVAAKAAEPGESVEVLLDAIAALDDLYRDGVLPADAYPERRAELLSRLREALDRKG